MNILYIHGYGGKIDYENEKVVALQTIGDVTCIDADYNLSRQALFDSASEEVKRISPDIIIGTSMGGWLAAKLSAEFFIPFVAFNPAVDPASTLESFGIEGSDYDPINRHGDGIIFLDKGDELFDSIETFLELGDSYHVIIFDGGSHKFEHIDESLNIIKKHADVGVAHWGIG